MRPIKIKSTLWIWHFSFLKIIHFILLPPPHGLTFTSDIIWAIIKLKIRDEECYHFNVMNCDRDEYRTGKI